MSRTGLLRMTHDPLAAEDEGLMPFAAALNTPVPFDWPPEFHDEKTRQQLRGLLDQPPTDAVFSASYIFSSGRPVETCDFALVDRRPLPDLGEILTYSCRRPATT
jgi:hypothetical protein